MTKKEEVELINVVLFAAFVLLYLRSSRFWNYLTVAELILVAPYGYVQKEKTGKMTYLEKMSVTLVLLCTMLIGITDINAFRKTDIVNDYPKQMYYDLRDVGGKRIFNEYGIGSQLIYNNIKVFVDGRYDLYSMNSMIGDYYKMMDAQAEEDTVRKEVMQKYQFSSFIINSDAELVKWLKCNGWIEYNRYKLKGNEQVLLIPAETQGKG